MGDGPIDPETGCLEHDDVDAPSPYWLVKADGLAAGKGVYCCRTTAEVLDAVRELVCARIFGDAGLRVMIEQVSDPPTPETRVENETHQRISAFEKITQLDADLAAARKELSVWSHESIRQVGEARAAQEAAEQRLHEIAAENLRADLADARGALLAAEATVGGLREALQRIVDWEMPTLLVCGVCLATLRDGSECQRGCPPSKPCEVSYGGQFGSNGERDVVRSWAREALATPAPTGEVVGQLVKIARKLANGAGYSPTHCPSCDAATGHDEPHRDDCELNQALAHPTLVGLGEKA